MSVTAIIPTTGRRPEMLARALRSVMAQRFSVQELLLVVDGPHDLGLQISQDHPEARVVSTGARRGVSAARNLGARHARSCFLAFLDDDDVWKQDHLAAVMADGADFDVALTAFEKHRPQDVAPEKIPPERLEAERFLVANPGLRGSNLVIRREVYLGLGGFDEGLLAFNDMDFGIRLSDAGPWRYRRILGHLVEFHSHRGPRLSTPGSQANLAGLAGFWERYAKRMTAQQREAFRERALKLWEVDPVALLQADVHLVGLGPGNDPMSLSHDAWLAASRCEQVFYPGDWVGEPLQAAFGARLSWGRRLTTQDVLEAACEAQRRGGCVAVLYNGDGRLFSGRPGCFASLGELEGLLTQRGLRVRSWSGVGSAQAALNAAGWQIPTEPGTGLMTAAPFCLGVQGCDHLRQMARSPAVLALLWCEDHGSAAFDVLLEERGPHVPVALVLGLGGDAQSVCQGRLGELGQQFAALRPPGVILVAQPSADPSSGIRYIGPQSRPGGTP